jgi:ATP-dependent DNA helicase RecQ
MKDYVRHDGCLMHFIAAALDDPTSVQPCGRCKNCRQSQSKFKPDTRALEAAADFLRQGKPIVFKPRKMWPTGLPGFKKATIQYVNADGLALCNYYDAGWAEQVKNGRFQSNSYSDELVTAAANALRKHLHSLTTPPAWVTAIPSRSRPTLVPGFAARLATALGLEFREVVEHVKQHPPQSKMLNSYQQANNVLNAFTVKAELSSEPVLLVDDLADSKWTLTVVGHLLRKSGSGMVHPFVLATTNSD